MKQLLLLVSCLVCFAQFSSAAAKENDYLPDYAKNADEKTKQYIKATFCSPDVCPKSEIDREISKCVDLVKKVGGNGVSDCILNLARRNPKPEVFDAISQGLSFGWLQKPWGKLVHQGLYQLLDSDEPAIRSQYYLWYRDEREMKGLPADPNTSNELYKKPSSAVPGVVQVSSFYGETQEIGTGSIVSAPELASNSSFVLTAAHLVGGENLSVRMNDQALNIKSLITDNDADIAILEIEKSNAFVGTYSTRTKRIQLTFELEQGYYAETLAYARLGVNLREILRNSPDAQSKALGLVFFLNPWNEAGFESQNIDYLSEDDSQSGLGLSLDGSYYRSRMKVTGGTSGSLVFSFVGRPVVEGIITQSNYYFQETYIPRAPLIANLFEAFEKGKRGGVSRTQWKMARGLTYRDYSNGWIEANFVNRPTGKGVVGDPGKGVVGDPGSNLQKFALWKESRPQAVFAHFGLQAGMRFKGRSIVGVYGTSKRPLAHLPSKLFLYADQTSLRFMNAHLNEYDFSVVESGSELLPFISRRLGIAFTETARFEMKSGAPKDFLKAAYNPRFTETATERSEMVLENGELRVRVKTYSANRYSETETATDDEIEFRLDRYGVLIGSNQKTFLPIIEVRSSKTGKTYYVDIRKLIFHDLSQIALPPLEKDKAKLRTEALRQLNSFGFKARNAKSGREFGFTFAPMN